MNICQSQASSTTKQCSASSSPWNSECSM